MEEKEETGNRGGRRGKLEETRGMRKKERGRRRERRWKFDSRVGFIGKRS